MTHRRWRFEEGDPETPQVGPMETDVQAELETLGYTPLTPPGILRTAARRALFLAETFDVTQNAAYLPALDRQLAQVMAEARQAADKAAGGLTGGGDDSGGPTDPNEDVDDFTRRRRERGAG